MEKTLRPEPGEKKKWVVYILLCKDGSFYTGITNDLSRRFREHREGRASRYTRSRKTLKIVYEERCKDRSQALRREAAVKALSRQGKEHLIKPGRRIKMGTERPARS